MITALVMAGGRSIRMRVGGSGLHKALRTIGGVPLIEWSLRALKGLELSQVFVSLSSEEHDLASWLMRHRERMAAELQVQPILIEELHPLGTIGAVALLPASISEVLVVNVDNLSDLDLAALVSTHRRTAAAATIACHDHQWKLPFGQLELSGDSVVRYVEKPMMATPVSSGTYVLSRTAIDQVTPYEPMDVPRLIAMLLHAGNKVDVFRHAAAWIDVNDEISLAQAAVIATTMQRGANTATGSHV